MMNDLQTDTGATSPWRPHKTKLRPLRAGPLASTAFAREWALERSVGTGSSTPRTRVFVVVGFDGSDSAKRALDAAVELLRNREGQLQVVHVAHVPASSTSSKRFEASTAASAYDMERRLSSAVRARLEPTERLWQYQRRDGAVADELVAAAEELRRQHDPDANIVLVVGGPSHHHQDVVDSVSSNLVRADRFPLVIVP
jgi:nucleotide-binding universal stress UspA family protein